MSTRATARTGAVTALIAALTPLSVLFALQGLWPAFVVAFLVMLGCITWMGVLMGRSRSQ